MASLGSLRRGNRLEALTAPPGKLRSESTKNGKYTQGRLTRHGYAFAWFRQYFPCVFCNLYRCGRHIMAESANMIATYSFLVLENLRMSFVPLAFSPRELVHRM